MSRDSEKRGPASGAPHLMGPIPNFSGTPASGRRRLSHPPGCDAYAQQQLAPEQTGRGLIATFPLVGNADVPLSMRPAGKRGGAVIEYLRDPLFSIIEYRRGDRWAARDHVERKPAHVPPPAR
jgi:hypothetical protein